MEIHALAARGWSVSAIARHAGRDRKTIAKYLKREGLGSTAGRRRAGLSRFVAASPRGSSRTAPAGR
jgi:IS30 family transposase